MSHPAESQSSSPVPLRHTPTLSPELRHTPTPTIGRSPSVVFVPRRDIVMGLALNPMDVPPLGGTSPASRIRTFLCLIWTWTIAYYLCHPCHVPLDLAMLLMDNLDFPFALWTLRCLRFKDFSYDTYETLLFQIMPSHLLCLA